MQNNDIRNDDSIVVEIIDEEEENIDPNIAESITKAATATLEFHDIYKGEVSVALVSSEQIQALNAEYREKDAVTDVLSFPQYESIEEIREEEYPYFGDVVICIEKAEEQAREFGHSFERELVYLTIHSVLHLLGYDHEEEDDQAKMRGAEKDIIKRIGVFKAERE